MTDADSQRELRLSDPEVLRDPYPTYREFRERGPIHYQLVNGRFPAWHVLSHAHVSEVLGSDDFVTSKLDPPAGVDVPEALRPVIALFSDVMLTRDGAGHTRLRGLVGKAFTPRTVERLAPRVQKIMDELLASALDRGDLDLVRDIGVPLPLIVIGELLGVPAEDHAQLKRWSDDIAPMLDGSIREQSMPGIVVASIQLRDYLAAALDERRKRPKEDLLSALLVAQEADDVLTDLEIVATSLLILGAGHETTTNLIGNGMRALLQHPEQMALLRAEPALVPSAVEEMLRYDSPVQLTARVPTEDAVVAGETIPAGQEINLVLGAANRDPAVFADPDRFDVARPDSNRHLSFSRGRHFCLGASLARLEGTIVVQTLLERLPGLAPATADVQRRPGVVLRGLSALPVRL